MLAAILLFHRLALEKLELGAKLEDILELTVRERIARMKFTPQENESELDAVEGDIQKSIGELLMGGLSSD